MSWQALHTWSKATELPRGRSLASVRISTCFHCETLRTFDDGTGAEHFTRRVDGPARVVEVSPPCVSPSRFFRVRDEWGIASVERPEAVPAVVAPAVAAPAVSEAGQLGLTW